MRKRWLVTTAVAAVMFASNAQASEPWGQAPVRWSGLYIGAHVGHGWGENKWRDFRDPMYYPQFPENLVKGLDASYDLDGVLAGGQIGYNWQIANGVLGLEADVSWANLDGWGANARQDPANNFFGGCLQQSQGCETKVQALGTITGRIGGIVDRALVYVKGGVAWAHEKHQTGYNDQTMPGDPLYNYGANPSVTRWGWTIGAGVEYALGAGWSGKIEYNYIDLADEMVKFNYTPSQTFSAGAISDEVLHTVKIGINYRFGN